MQPVGYFVASLVFITMPPVFCMIGCLFLNLWNKELKKRNCREKLEAVLRAAIQAIVSPIAAVLITGAYLVLDENKAEEFEDGGRQVQEARRIPQNSKIRTWSKRGRNSSDVRRKI